MKITTKTGLKLVVPPIAQDYVVDLTSDPITAQTVKQRKPLPHGYSYGGDGTYLSSLKVGGANWKKVIKVAQHYVTVTEAVQALLDAFKAKGGDIQQPEWSVIGEMRFCMAAVRDWGNWQVPDGEVDDGDYDWKELTPASKKRAGEIFAAVEKRFPTVTLSWSVDEKNWISFDGR